MHRPIACSWPPLREADKLWIAGNSVSSNVVLLESILHVYSARLVKVDTLSLHDAHDFLLPRIIKALARVARLYIATEVKC